MSTIKSHSSTSSASKSSSSSNGDTSVIPGFHGHYMGSRKKGGLPCHKCHRTISYASGSSSNCKAGKPCCKKHGCKAKNLTS